MSDQKPSQIGYFLAPLFLLAFAVQASLYGQSIFDRSIRFETFGITEGISQNSVNVLMGDQTGYLWLGTQAGIDRYDGYEFYNFENSAIKEGGPSIVWCHAIAKDENGILWFGDQLGNISSYNPFQDRWTNYTPFNKLTNLHDLPEQALKVNSIVADTSGVIYFGSQALGLFRLDAKTAELEQIKLEQDEIRQPQINELKWSASGELFIATEQGLYKYLPSSANWTKPNAFSLGSLAIRDFASIHAQKWLVATSKGLWKWDLSTNTFETVLGQDHFSKQGSSSSLSAVHYHSQTKDIWMSVENTGLAMTDSLAKELRIFSTNNSRELGIESVTFFQIYEDQQGILWFASYTQGLVKYDPLAQRMQLIGDRAGAVVPLGFETVWGVLIDQKNQIWTGNIEPGGGVHLINREKGTNQSFLTDNPMVGSRRWAFAEDQKGGVWIYHNTTNDVKVYKSTPSNIHPKYVGLASNLGDGERFTARAATYLTKNGDLLLCGNNAVIRIADLDGNSSFERFGPLDGKVEGRILDFYANAEQSYFMTKDQLYRWDEMTNEIEAILDEDWGVDFLEVGASNDIQFVVLDDSYLYLPTYGKGLYSLNLKNGQSDFLANSDGLPNRYLYNCYVDGENNLWMSSNFGIIQFMVNEKRFFSYGPNDGAQAYEFNANSSYQSANNEIAFGGIAGLNIFSPEAVQAESNPPNIIIQSIQIGNTQIPYGHSGNRQQSAQVYDYSSNSVSFDFVAFNFRNTEKNQYAYQLIGYEDSLIGAGNRRFQSYTNLPEDTYTFKVVAANHQGNWNNTGASYSFTILPPWYRTWWAYSSYFLALFIGVLLYNQYRVKKERRMAENQRKEEELEAARAFQQRMLPLNIPSNEFFDIDARQITSTEVGGDYYDFFTFEPHKISVVCGDATGHGTASGMMVSVTKAALQALESGNPERVNNIMEDLNRVIKTMNLGTSRMSLILMHIDGKKVRFASAAMPPVYIYRAAEKRVDECMTGDMPLGALKRQKYELYEFELESEDVIVLLSDGLPEAPNPKGDLLDYQPVMDCIRENGQKSSKDILKSLFNLGTDWMKTDIPPDDITAVVVKALK